MRFCSALLFANNLQSSCHISHALATIWTKWNSKLMWNHVSTVAKMTKWKVETFMKHVFTAKVHLNLDCNFLETNAHWISTLPFDAQDAAAGVPFQLFGLCEGSKVPLRASTTRCSRTGRRSYKRVKTMTCIMNSEFWILDSEFRIMTCIMNSEF